jgi:heat shock protein HspQ
MDKSAKFAIGELVRHRLFDYRGVVVDVDPEFQLTDDWYDAVARSRPPKDQPWYRVLVHDATHDTYVAERNLEADLSGDPIKHPGVKMWFTGLQNGRYRTGTPLN